jgi:hypothetical protein
MCDHSMHQSAMTWYCCGGAYFQWKTILCCSAFKNAWKGGNHGLGSCSGNIMRT